MPILVNAKGQYILAGARGFISVNNPAGVVVTPPPTGNPLTDDTVPGGTSGTTALTLTDFYSSHQYARPVIQRSALSMNDAGGPWGDVPVLFTFTGTQPAYPQARVVKASDGSAVTGWKTLTNISVVGNSMLGTLPKVPQGGYYLLQVRDGQKTTVFSNGTKSWGVGVVVLAVGQSNMLGTLAAGSYTDPVPVDGSIEYDYWFAGKSGGTQFGTSGYIHPNNGTPGGGSSVDPLGGGVFSTMRIVSARLAAKYGKTVPVGFVPWAFSGKTIGEMAPDGAMSTALFNGSGTTANSIGMKSPGNIFGGDFEIMAWHQGETGTETYAQYLQALKDIYTNILARVSPFGRNASSLWFLPAVLGVYADVTLIESRRKAVLDFDAYAKANNWPKVRAGWNCLDLDPVDGGDGLHFQDVSGGNKYRTWSVRRMTQAILYALGCSTFTGLGPKISGITRSGNVLTAIIAHDGGSALVARKPGQPITGWSVKDNGGNTITATVAIASANTITLTLAGSPVYPVSVQHGGGIHPDVTNLIVDDKAYPEGCTGTDLLTNGRPILPTPDPIVVN